jgi:hypothetical protein
MAPAQSALVWQTAAAPPQLAAHWVPPFPAGQHNWLFMQLSTPSHTRATPPLQSSAVATQDERPPAAAPPPTQHTGIAPVQLIVPQTTLGGGGVLVELVMDVDEVVVTGVVVAVGGLVVTAEPEPVPTAVVDPVPLAVAVADEDVCVASDVEDAAPPVPPSPTVERSVEFEPLHAASHTTPSAPRKLPTVFMPSPFSVEDGTVRGVPSL